MIFSNSKTYYYEFIILFPPFLRFESSSSFHFLIDSFAISAWAKAISFNNSAFPFNSASSLFLFFSEPSGAFCQVFIGEERGCVLQMQVVSSPLIDKLWSHPEPFWTPAEPSSYTLHLSVTPDITKCILLLNGPCHFAEVSLAHPLSLQGAQLLQGGRWMMHEPRSGRSLGQSRSGACSGACSSAWASRLEVGAEVSSLETAAQRSSFFARLQ